MVDKINLAGKTFEELWALFLCEVADDDDFYDVLAHNLAKEDRHRFEGVIQSLSDKRLRAAIVGLGTVASPDNGISDLVIRYVGHSDPLVVAAAIDALRHAGSVDWPKIEATLRHPSAYVRGAALRFARARLGARSLPMLVEHLRDSDPIVRQNALDELEGIATPQEAHLVASCLNDPSSDVRQAARTLLASLTP